MLCCSYHSGASLPFSLSVLFLLTARQPHRPPCYSSNIEAPSHPGTIYLLFTIFIYFLPELFSAVLWWFAPLLSSSVVIAERPVQSCRDTLHITPSSLSCFIFFITLTTIWYIFGSLFVWYLSLLWWPTAGVCEVFWDVVPSVLRQGSPRHTGIEGPLVFSLEWKLMREWDLFYSPLCLGTRRVPAA